MKKMDMKTILFLVLILFLSLFSFILLVGYLLNEVSKSKDLQGFQIAISFAGIFATFGGAYLGAKISGENAIHNIKRQNYIDKVDKLKALQSEILFNMEYMWSFLSNSYKEIGFTTKDVKNQFDLKKSIVQNTFSVIYKDLATKNLSILKLSKVHYLNLCLLRDVINNNSREYRLFDELFSDYEGSDSYHNINKFYKLKQTIDSLDRFITIEGDYACIDINVWSKQYLISLYYYSNEVNDILQKEPELNNI